MKQIKTLQPRITFSRDGSRLHAKWEHINSVVNLTYSKEASNWITVATKWAPPRDLFDRAHADVTLEWNRLLNSLILDPTTDEHI